MRTTRGTESGRSQAKLPHAASAAEQTAEPLIMNAKHLSARLCVQ